jgi:hypothetical protein
MSEEQFVPVDLESPNNPSNVPPTPPPVPDGFADDLFAPLDTRPGDLDNEDLIVPPIPSTEPIPAPTPAPPAPSAPEVIEYEDGSSLSIEKTNRGWKSTLNSGVGKPEIFYGKTKEEMWTNVASAKMHATRRIHDLNREVKLTARPEPAPQGPVQPVPQTRQLTADEIVEVTNQLKSNPSLAFDTYFQKRTGLTIDQLVNLANEGRQARQELEAESVVRVFKARHPEYLVVDGNYKSMLGWLAKYKLGRTLTDQNAVEITEQLYQRGQWTVENLDEAYGDLAQDGLLDLDLGPSEEEEEVPPTPPQAPQPPPNPRIANVRVGQRAGLGIRQRETSPVPPRDATRPPSDEELDAMSDADITAHFAAIRRYRAQQARR